jgi:cytochrome c peroxidase
VCHGPAVGWTGPDSSINKGGSVYEGSVDGLFGNRKPPTAAYAGFAPALHWNAEDEVWVGGMFWDGRSTGWVLGDPVAEQAQGPFLNPVEMALPDAAAVCEGIAAGNYADSFAMVFGEGSLDCGEGVDHTYELIGRAIAAYEKSQEVSPFTSKFDYYLKGEVELTEQEMLGLEIFEGDKAMCSACHPTALGENGELPLLTDFTYDNLGAPKNPDNPFYDMPEDVNPDGAKWVDTGLGGFLKSAGYDEETYMAEWGKVKVPTLRNVALKPNDSFVKAFGHNGYFKSLEDIVHFYNTRDVGDWPEPEVAENVNTDELGDLGLTAEEEAAIVAFLETLSDGYVPE